MDHHISSVIEPLWPAPDNIIAVVTSRTPPEKKFETPRTAFDSFNLATHVEDDLDSVEQNRSSLAAYLKQLRPLTPRQADTSHAASHAHEEVDLAWNWINQTHSNQAVEFPSQDDQTTNTRTNHSDPILDADAIYTTRPMAVCAVLTADCLPILVCTHDGRSVGAIHAGWRGLAKGVIHNAISAICQRSGAKPSQLYAWLGPAIGTNHFEVGLDVLQVFSSSTLNCSETASALSQAFRPSKTKPDKFIADIWQLGSIALRQCGVHHIYGGGLCTFSDERFYSYRRDGKTGRMASLIFRRD